MTETPTGPELTTRDNACYRHPDRQSFVLCQRCARTVCGECQTPAPVGVICPECMAADRASAPRTRRRLPTGAPRVTYALMAICVVVYAGQWLTQQSNFPVIDYYGTYMGAFTDPALGVFEPWRMLTSAFLHGGLLHLAMNMLTLWIFGRALEPLFGPVRFLLLYLASALGGSLMVAILAPDVFVVGASGAIFGLVGAWFVVLRRMSADMSPMLVLIGINVVMAFLNPGIAWEAHLGGLLVGLACGWLALRDHDKAFKSRTGIWAISAIAVGCLVAAPLVAVAQRAIGA